jgi:hypothetical protein
VARVFENDKCIIEMENKKYSLLIVAIYCITTHVREIVDHLKTKNPLVDITILTDKPTEMKRILVDKSVKLENYNVSLVNCKYRWLRFLLIKHKQKKFFKYFAKNRKYDIVNVHYPFRYMSFVFKSLRTMSDNVVITPWGSDLLRRDKTSLKQLKKLYEKADFITMTANSTGPIGKILLHDFKIDPKKMVGSFWGTDIVDYAIKNGDSISQDDAKERFGLSGQYVITCGYNRQKAQQHKAIIAAIDQYRNQLPKNLTLLFPMTYGNMLYQGKYVEEVKEECKKRRLHAIFITEFLSVKDLYKLRKATDLFVHVQTTDAGSRSVYEYILCDKKIVHGSWVSYKKLESFKPLFYFPVDTMENLGEVIVKAYNSDNIEIPQGVMDIVMSRSWDNKISQMNDFFMSIV